MTITVTLEQHLRERRDGGRKLLMPYLSGGVTADWTDHLLAIIANGADGVEVGIPFSDPVMDGPTIQAASELALARGTTPGSVLADLRAVATEVDVPLIAMTYANIAFRTGARRFAAEAVDAGVGGVILPDVPIEELGAWEPAAQGVGLQTVLLASPVNSEARLDEICRRAEGFVYGVNLLGVTGVRAEVGERASTLARKLKAVTDMPVVMGFGVSNGEQARALTTIADGVVVGSAVVQRVVDGATPAELGRFIAELRSALDAA